MAAMALSKTNTAVVLLVGFVNYLEWAVVMTSIYPYIVSASIHIILYYDVLFRSFLRNYAELELIEENKSRSRHNVEGSFF